MSRKKKAAPPEQLSEEREHLFAALNNGSDLACALIGGSAVEQALGSLLMKHFLPGGTSEKLLNPSGGALGTFSARIDLAYCLGLISKELLENAHTIALIRNEFAHSHLDLHFADAGPAELCMKLKVLKFSRTESEVHPLDETHEKDPRARFTLAVVMVQTRLLLTALGAQHREANRIEF